MADGDTDDVGAGATLVPEAPAEPVAPAEAEAPAAARKSGEWTPEAYQKQIDRQHRRIKDLELAEQAARVEAERLRALTEAATRREQPGGTPGAPPAPEPPVRSAGPPQPRQEWDIDPPTLMAEARFQLQIESLDKDLAKNPEWNSSLENIRRVMGDDKAAFRSIVEGVLGTDNPAKVLVELGRDPAQLQSILDMTPQARNNKFIRMDIDLAQPKPKPRPSDAPEPVAAIRAAGGAAAPAELSDKLSDDEWYAKRLEQKRHSSGRPWSPKAGTA